MVKTQQEVVEQAPIVAKSPKSKRIKKIPRKPVHKALTSKSKMRAEGHRGTGLLEPENTITAFNRAIELGLDGIELDVWLTSDHVPIVVHGKENNGTIIFEDNRAVLVEQISFEELRKTKLIEGHIVPTLKEVLEVCKGKIVVNIELKGENLLVVEKVFAVVHELKVWDDISISSFYHPYYDKINETLREMGVEERVYFGWLAHKLEEIPDYKNKQFKENDSLNLDIQLLTEYRDIILDHINKAKEQKQRIKFYFPMKIKETTEIYNDLLSLGTDTIITNYPIDLLDYLKDKIDEKTVESPLLSDVSDSEVSASVTESIREIRNGNTEEAENSSESGETNSNA